MYMVHVLKAEIKISQNFTFKISWLCKNRNVYALFIVHVKTVHLIWNKKSKKVVGLKILSGRS